MDWFGTGRTTAGYFISLRSRKELDRKYSGKLNMHRLSKTFDTIHSSQNYDSWGKVFLISWQKLLSTCKIPCALNYCHQVEKQNYLDPGWSYAGRNGRTVHFVFVLDYTPREAIYRYRNWDSDSQEEKLDVSSRKSSQILNFPTIYLLSQEIS